MNFSVHFDEETVAELTAAVARSGLARNRIIGLAVREWLARNAERDWPGALAAHFRNPAPELAAETVDPQSWRERFAPDTSS
jgi:hypothetical protein